jgi:hypothetical protein
MLFVYKTYPGIVTHKFVLIHSYYNLLIKYNIIFGAINQLQLKTETNFIYLVTYTETNTVLYQIYSPVRIFVIHILFKHEPCVCK